MGNKNLLKKLFPKRLLSGIKTKKTKEHNFKCVNYSDEKLVYAIMLAYNKQDSGK